MSQFDWETCPVAVKEQVMHFARQVVHILSDSIVGIYLHGSLAMGCFNPVMSDLDLLVVTERSMAVQTKRRLVELLLVTSQAPCPVEISFLVHGDFVPWQFPTPFDLHYSESWRQRCEEALRSGGWQQWNGGTQTDPDLAAHCTITTRRGICLYGQPIAQIFPDVPAADYLASICGDVDDALRNLWQNPVYAILNACRVYAYIRDGLVCSKQEGGEWALNVLPMELRPLVEQALTAYATGRHPVTWDAAAIDHFVATMYEQLQL